MTSSEFHDYVMQDLFADIEGVSSRKMFGGYGIYLNGVIFAIIADDELYFKVGKNNIEDYKKLNSHPFIYSQGNHKPTTMSYWLVPEEILEDKNKLKEWILKSVKASKK